jgi:signal transduction histidine kinase/HD-like signal output (HDOD) protein
MSDLREKRVELILQQLEELPTLPAVAVRVLEVTSDDTSTAREVVELISSDPALTARILQLVHRADAGVRGEVNSIERAVVLLGFEAVRSAVLAVTVFHTLGAAALSADNKGHFSREAFWKHCVAVACCAELLAAAANRNAFGSILASGMPDAQAPARQPRDARDGRAPAPGMTPAAGRAHEPLNASEAFICGLLHDIGKVALDAVLPKSFSRVVEAADLLRGNIADVERTVIGLDHMVVGKRLAERWDLPAVIRDCAWLHGQPPQALPANVRQPRMVNLVTLSDLLAREQHLGYSGNYTFTVSKSALMEAVGVTPAQVTEAMKHLVEQIEPRAKALGLGEASSGELYQHALAQANRELGRVSGQLAAKNRKLAVRARFFDALSSFQAELHPDAPPQTVLHAIGQTAVSVLGVRCAAVFSLPPGQNYAEAVLCDASGEVFETSLIDLPKASVVSGPSSVAGALDDAIQGGSASAIQQLTTDNGQRTSRPSKPEAGDGPVMAAGNDMEWFVGAISPRLTDAHRFWICLEADGACIGGVVWGAPAGEGQRLSPQVQELSAIATGWALALRTAQIREEARTLAEQLAEANRRLHNAQSEILRSRMMISIGEMAAGAAHEMNNPLAVISGRSQLLAQQLTDPKHKAAAHLIHEQSHRLSAIITELMDFAKPEPPHPKETDLAELVARSLHEAKMQTDPADRTFEVTMTDVPPVVVDPRQVAAALIEVIDNSIHATDAATGHIELHAAFDPYSSRVVVTVSDNGCGMDEASLKRAFDPFFSNKPAGRRRGLGLAKALRWIEASGGSIRLESRSGQGTRGVILLPAVRAAASESQAAERKVM